MNWPVGVEFLVSAWRFGVEFGQGAIVLPHLIGIWLSGQWLIDWLVGLHSKIETRTSQAGLGLIKYWAMDFELTQCPNLFSHASRRGVNVQIELPCTTSNNQTVSSANTKSNPGNPVQIEEILGHAFEIRASEPINLPTKQAMNSSRFQSSNVSIPLLP